MPARPRSKSAAGPPGATNIATAYASAHPSWIKSRVPFVIVGLVAFVAFFIYRRAVTTRPLRTEAIVPDALDSAGPRDVNASRIAVCYSGHVGTLSKVYRQNLHALQQVTTSQPSFFFVLDLHDDFRDVRTGRHFQNTHEIGTLQSIFDELSARAVETFSSADIIESYRRQPCVGDHVPVTDDGGHYSQSFAVFHAAAKCYSHVKKEEANSGIPFDWILRLRPDMEIALRLPPPDAKPRIHMSGIPMALIPRGLADDYFSVVDLFEGHECKKFDQAEDNPCAKYSYALDSPECLIVKWLHSKGVTPSNGLFVNRRIVYPEEED